MSHVVDEVLSVGVETELDGDVGDATFNPTSLRAHASVRLSRIACLVEKTQEGPHEFQVTASFLGAVA